MKQATVTVRIDELEGAPLNTPAAKRVYNHRQGRLRRTSPHP